MFTGRLKNPVCSLPSLLRRLLALLLFLHRRLRSRTGQRVDKGVLVLGRSPALTVSGGLESRKHQIVTFSLENVNTLYPHHFSILSFHLLIPSSVPSQRWQNFWWPVSASFHQRYCNQLSLDQKTINHRPFSLLKWDFFFSKNLDGWFLENVEVLKSIFDHQSSCSAEQSVGEAALLPSIITLIRSAVSGRHGSMLSSSLHFCLTGF